MKNSIFLLAVVSVTILVIYGFGRNVQDDWAVPSKYQTMKNPVVSNSSSISNGKSLYALHCKSCHGKEGLGDGPKAANLDTHCGDFTDEDFQSQSDGALFYKTFTGKGDMPSFEKKLPDANDIWSIINYIRTLE